MLERILVPTDFSAPSDAVLSYARLLANTYDASLHLLHVTATRSTPPSAPSDSWNREPAALCQLRDRLTADDRRRRIVVRVLEAPDPARQIVRYARAMDIDLIVMGTHGRSAVAQLLMGSVAEKVVRTAPCPVFTAHDALRASAAGFRRILMPTDFGLPSYAALNCARRLAASFAASLHLLHVLEEVPSTGGIGWSELFINESPEARSLRLRDARDRLKQQISDGRVTLGATTEVIVGSPARVIANYAADNRFDLIVMGTHGRTGMAHLLLGSVAERVVRSASCPVVTTQYTWQRAAAVMQQAEMAAAAS
jgi:nucleotide-binding universal stress UspA family protein